MSSCLCAVLMMIIRKPPLSDCLSGYHPGYPHNSQHSTQHPSLQTHGYFPGQAGHRKLLVIVFSQQGLGREEQRNREERTWTHDDDNCLLNMRPSNITKMLLKLGGRQNLWCSGPVGTWDSKVGTTNVIIHIKVTHHKR